MCEKHFYPPSPPKKKKNGVIKMGIVCKDFNPLPDNPVFFITLRQELLPKHCCQRRTRCVCERPVPPQRPFFENCDLDIRLWPS